MRIELETRGGYDRDISVKEVRGEEAPISTGIAESTSGFIEGVQRFRFDFGWRDDYPREDCEGNVCGPRMCVLEGGTCEEEQATSAGGTVEDVIAKSSPEMGS